MERQINISLTANEVNRILIMLGGHPFKEVSDLIFKIKAQGDAQLMPEKSTDAQPAIQ